jgi:signal transduction histidine kinase
MDPEIYTSEWRSDSPSESARGEGESRLTERSRRAFLAHMRQELRTPLNAIVGYADLLIEEVKQQNLSALLPSLQRIYRLGQELMTQADEFLDLAHIYDLGIYRPQARSEEKRREMRNHLVEILDICEKLQFEMERRELDELLSDLRKIYFVSRTSIGLVDDIIQFSQNAFGKFRRESETENVHEMVQDILTTVRPVRPGFTSHRNPYPSRLLVADDNLLNRNLLSRQLTRYGHTVVVAENGEQVLEILREAPFDLVLLDMMMPVLNGYQTLEQIKEDPDLCRIPVIMISALDEMDAVVRCIELGAEDYLSKPFNPMLLKARINACLEKQHLRKQETSLYRELEANYSRLKELESMRDSLTHMIVHDLRTPLTGIITSLQTMPLLGDLNGDQSEMLEMALENGETLLEMICDLLDINKMESGALKLDYEELKPAEAVGAAVKQVLKLIESKNLVLRVDVPESLPPLRADAGKLRRTLVNLLGNAIKFTPAGGRISVSAEALEESAKMVFTVRDSGRGIPKEAFAHIFEKFGQVTTGAACEKRSTGLGLTFCRLAVEAHGGRIWVESELGQGSAFFFELPLLPQG